MAFLSYKNEKNQVALMQLGGLEKLFSRELWHTFVTDQAANELGEHVLTCLDNLVTVMSSLDETKESACAFF